MRSICATFAQNCSYFSNAQDLRKVVLLSQCAIYAHVLLSPMRNICTRFVQDCTYFSNAQYMRKTCARLYLFLQCALQDVPKPLLESGEQCIVGSPFDIVFSRCLT